VSAARSPWHGRFQATEGVDALFGLSGMVLGLTPATFVMLRVACVVLPELPIEQ
jgi:hypothetical protein